MWRILHLHKPLELKSLEGLPFPCCQQGEAERGVFVLFLQPSLQPSVSIALGGTPLFGACRYYYNPLRQNWSIFEKVVLPSKYIFYFFLINTYLKLLARIPHPAFQTFQPPDTLRRHLAPLITNPLTGNPPSKGKSWFCFETSRYPGMAFPANKRVWIVGTHLIDLSLLFICNNTEWYRDWKAPLVHWFNRT